MDPSVYTKAMQLLEDARTNARLAAGKVSPRDGREYRERERKCRLKAVMLLRDDAP